VSNEAITWAFKQELPMTDKFVLVALADYADEAHMCFPSYQKTAGRIGASPDTVKRATKRLNEAGYIDIIPWKRPNGSTTSNRYRLKVGGATCTPPQDATPPGYVVAGEAPGTGASPINHQLIPQVNQDVSDGLAEAFEDWWKLYPSKARGAKSKALTQYKKRAKEHGAAELKTMLSMYLRAKATEKATDGFTPNPPHAERWLRDERWNDYGQVVTITRANGTQIPGWSKTECDEILGGSDHWSCPAPPEGLTLQEEVTWKREQVAAHLDERRQKAWEVINRGSAA